MIDNYFSKELEKTAFRINKKILIGAAAISPVTALLIYHNKKLFPKGTFHGEYARTLATDIGADAVLTGIGAAIGKAFKRPGAGAIAGITASYIVPSALNTKRMLKGVTNDQLR